MLKNLIYFIKNHNIKIKLAIFLPGILFLLISIFSSYNIPINKKVVNKEWVDFINNSGFNYFIDMITNALNVEPFDLIKKILLLFILLFAVLIAILIFYRAIKTAIFIITLLSRYIYMGCTNYYNGSHIVLDIPAINLKFYREWTKEEIMDFIDRAINMYGRPGLEQEIDKEKALNYIMQQDPEYLITENHFLSHATDYIRDYHMDALLLTDGWQNFLCSSWNSLFIPISVACCTLAPIVLIYLMYVDPQNAPTEVILGTSSVWVTSYLYLRMYASKLWLEWYVLENKNDLIKLPFVAKYMTYF